MVGFFQFIYIRIGTLTSFRDGDDGPWSTFGVQIGTPGQQFRVLPATGLDVTWVIHPQGCSIFSDQASCAQARGGIYISDHSSTWNEIGLYELSIYEEAMLGYSGNGSYGYETVTLGWPGNNLPSVEKQVIAGITTTEFYLGALGLNPWPVNFTELDNSHPSLLSTLKNQSKIPSLTWAYTAGAYNYNPPVFGSLTLGGFDISRFIPNNLHFSMGEDISRDLLVAVQSITTNMTSSDSSLLSNPIYAYINSLVPYMWLPLDACTAFEKSFNLTWNSTAQLYLVPDSLHQILLAQNPTVAIIIGPSTSGDNISIEMPYWSFMLNASYPLVNDNLRYFPVKRADNDTQYTLGRVFLQNAYVIANYELFNFSVYQAKYPDASVTQQIIAICPRGGCGGSFHGLRTGIIIAIVLSIVAAIAIISLGIWLYFFHDRSPVQKEEHSNVHQNEPLHNKPELSGIGVGNYEAPDTPEPRELPTEPGRGMRTLVNEAYELPASEPVASEIHTPNTSLATTPHLAPCNGTRREEPHTFGHVLP